jgi:hypothetical protein
MVIKENTGKFHSLKLVILFIKKQGRNNPLLEIKYMQEIFLTKY